MGAWSADPLGNDAAVDWAWDLDDEDSWGLVRTALEDGVAAAARDEQAACIAIAAAEVVAHALGRPTQHDAYTEEVEAFVERVTGPPTDLVTLARQALAAAASPASALATGWQDAGDAAWRAANARIATALAD